jgi:hypothetical protein
MVKIDHEAGQAEFILYDDIICEDAVDGKLVIDKSNHSPGADWDDKLRYDWMFSIRNGDDVYTICQGHCCTGMIDLGCVGDDCGGGDNACFQLNEITCFMEMLKDLHKSGRISGPQVLSMTGNCCS